MTYVFNGGVGIFITSKIILHTTTPTCFSFQLVWNSAGLYYSKMCSFIKCQGNLMTTLCFGGCAGLRRGGIVNFTSVGKLKIVAL